MPERTKVFISYAHADREYLDTLRPSLKALEQRGLVTIFDDTRIKPGEPWDKTIKTGLAEAKVALLLLSQNFLASGYISETELKALLPAAEAGELTLLSVYVLPCDLDLEPTLKQFQGLHDFAKPFAGMNPVEQAEVGATLSKRLREIFPPNPPKP